MDGAIEGRHDRVLGGLLGVACGDSLGATTEFERAPRPREQWVTEIVGGGVFGLPAGAPTDDTELTLALLRAYEACGHDGGPELVEAACDHFVAWFEQGPPDVGVTTATALSALRAGVSWRVAGDTTPQAQANGSLMRCIPTGLARHDEAVRRREAAELSLPTHASAVCLDACVAYCDVVSALVDGVGVVAALEAPAGRRGATPEVDAVLTDPATAPGQPLPFQSGGWVLTALRIAVWAVRQERSAEDLLVEIVNHGGDADTNGAIAGGLLGVRDGASALPARWVERLQVGDELRRGAQVLLDLRTRG